MTTSGPQTNTALRAPRSAGSRRFVRAAIAFGIVALAVALFPWVRPLIPTGDRCHPEGQPTVKYVAVSVCVDPGTWSWIDTYQRARQSYGEGPHKIYFDTIGEPQVLPQPLFRDAIIRYVEQYATNGEGLRIVAERAVTLGGRTWQVIEFASETATFIDYYYAADGIGSVQLLFQSFKPDVAERDALAGPILDSVSFGADAAPPANPAQPAV